MVGVGEVVELARASLAGSSSSRRLREGSLQCHPAGVMLFFFGENQEGQKLRSLMLPLQHLRASAERP